MESILQLISKQPSSYTYGLNHSGYALILRPLNSEDKKEVALFLENLSEETKSVFTYKSFDAKQADELCDAIGKYDKLRYVVENLRDGSIIGIFEFSFDLTSEDLKRFSEYGVSINQNDTCRFGPVLADEFQGKGIASKVMPYIFKTAQLFERNKIILWGGVFNTNHKAIDFYLRNGFLQVGEFLNSDNKKCIDMICYLD